MRSVLLSRLQLALELERVHCVCCTFSEVYTRHKGQVLQEGEIPPGQMWQHVMSWEYVCTVYELCEPWVSVSRCKLHFECPAFCLLSCLFVSTLG